MITNGELIRKLRVQRGLTIDQLGDVAGVSGSQIAFIETGKRNAGVVVLKYLADYFGCSMDELVISNRPETA